MEYQHRDIRFASSDDGVAIAHWAIGDGKPVVILNNWGISHSELEWTVPSIAAFYIRMAERYRVIRYDPRGTGLSEDPPGGWGALTESGAQQGVSTTEMGLDIAAVASALDLDNYAMLAVSVQGPVAIEYAARHSEVSELIFCDSFATPATSFMAPYLQSQAALRALEENSGLIFNAWEKVAPQAEIKELLDLVRTTEERGKLEPATLAQMEWDSSALLGDIAIPALIISSRSSRASHPETLPDSRALASGIRDSTLRTVAGEFAPYFSDQQAILEAIDVLLKPSGVVRQARPTSFRTVVFTDIVESTEYVRTVGDAAGRAAIRSLEQQIATLAADHDGRVVKNLGDGSLVSFGSNSAAIAFGLKVQEKCGDGPLQLRVGMAAGEPIQEDGDIHGTVVAFASRISDLGEAGEVVVSDSVRQLAAGKGYSFTFEAEVMLKGFDEPQRVWKVDRNAGT